MTKSEACDKSEAIGGLSTRAEKEAIWDLGMQYIPNGGLAIEVGTWTGGSAVILGEVCRQKNARLICIDAFSSDMHGLSNGVRADAFHTVLSNCATLPIDFMCGDSTRFVDYLAAGIADFIFIDGDHHYPRAKIDIEGYWNILKPGGGYLIHDYGNPCDVKQIVDSFFTGREPKHIDSSVFIEKELV